MIDIFHLNCGSMHAPPWPPAVCHCLLLRSGPRLILVDTGLGLLDVAQGSARLGQEMIAGAGLRLIESETAYRQIEAMGLSPSSVSDIILTHADPDHVGGLSDFPQARVHLSAEELAAVEQGTPRYVPAQFSPRPKWVVYAESDDGWFGTSARGVDLGLERPVLLIPLPGHTVGHCGVALPQGDRWLLHVGDAYYLREELDRASARSSPLAAARAEDNAARERSLALLRRLRDERGDSLQMLGYHDPAEMPSADETTAQAFSSLR